MCLSDNHVMEAIYIYQLYITQLYMHATLYSAIYMYCDGPCGVNYS